MSNHPTPTALNDSVFLEQTNASLMAMHVQRGPSAERTAARPAAPVAAKDASLDVGHHVQSRLRVLNGWTPGKGVEGAPFDPVNLYRFGVGVLSACLLGTLPPSSKVLPSSSPKGYQPPEMLNRMAFTPRPQPQS